MGLITVENHFFIKTCEMKVIVFAVIIIYSVFSSCSKSISPEELYGRWKYIIVTNSTAEENLTDSEIREQDPSITFSKNHDLVIEWGGKRLSYGKFRMEGRMIRYTETLGGNRTRDFPFLITKLTGSELVFQTMKQEFTTVTAEKVNELPVK